MNKIKKYPLIPVVEHYDETYYTQSTFVIRWLIFILKTTPYVGFESCISIKPYEVRITIGIPYLHFVITFNLPSVISKLINKFTFKTKFDKDLKNRGYGI